MAVSIEVRQITASDLWTGRYSDGTTVVSPSFRHHVGWVSGGGVGEAQQYFEVIGTAAVGGAFWDLSGGSAETDIFGAALGMTNVHAFFMRNVTTTAGLGITLTGDFITTIWSTSAGFLLNPGGKIEWASTIGKDITAGGNTISYIRSGGSDATFHAFVVGTVLEE